MINILHSEFHLDRGEDSLEGDRLHCPLAWGQPDEWPHFTMGIGRVTRRCSRRCSDPHWLGGGVACTPRHRLGENGPLVYSFSLACLLGERGEIVADTVGLCGLQLDPESELGDSTQQQTPVQLYSGQPSCHEWTELWW